MDADESSIPWGFGPVYNDARVSFVCSRYAYNTRLITKAFFN